MYTILRSYMYCLHVRQEVGSHFYNACTMSCVINVVKLKEPQTNSLLHQRAEEKIKKDCAIDKLEQVTTYM